MKNIIAYFVELFLIIWNFFFGKSKEDKIVDSISDPQTKWTSNPKTPPHNNRKVRKGRLVQYINVGAGRKRAIYHSAK